MENTQSAPPITENRFDAHFEEKNQLFHSGETLAYAFRKKKLKDLRAAIVDNQEEISTALKKDLNNSPAESFLTEIGIVLSEIDTALKNLRRWMRPSRKFGPILIEPSSSKVYYSPKGVVLIIAPWNYPFYLTFAPLVGAIAAGNTAVVKPSEEAHHSAQVIEKIIHSTFDRNYISVVQGQGHIVVPALMENHVFNHVFFTGSTQVGKAIAKAAARTLTGTTLELGGKSPAIIHPSANLKVAARRIAWGKFTNAGQTCVSPDYLLVFPSVMDPFVKELKLAITELYGDDASKSPDYSRIINRKRFESISAYLGQGTLISGGNSDSDNMYIEPTIILQPDMTDSVMQDEIFGPVLPVLEVENMNEVQAIISKNPYPLSAYFFGTDKTAIEIFKEKVAFGGGCINDTLIHLANSNLPFGGIMGSGQGRYHGKYSFLCFSNEKGIVHSFTFLDPSLRYPPYSNSKLKWLKRLF